jgi:hypothetical protein
LTRTGYIISLDPRCWCTTGKRATGGPTRPRCVDPCGTVLSECASCNIHHTLLRARSSPRVVLTRGGTRIRILYDPALVRLGNVDRLKRLHYVDSTCGPRAMGFISWLVSVVVGFRLVPLVDLPPLRCILRPVVISVDSSLIGKRLLFFCQLDRMLVLDGFPHVVIQRKCACFPSLEQKQA